jgi:single-strand DNA-binding protein
MELVGRERNVGKVSIAVNGFNKEDTNFIPITCFGKNAENGAKYIYKGMLIAVEGRISQNSYEKDGTKYNSIEVIADKIEYLDKIKHEVNDIKEADLKTITQSDIQVEIKDSDLPF